MGEQPLDGDVDKDWLKRYQNRARDLVASRPRLLRLLLQVKAKIEHNQQRIAPGLANANVMLRLLRAWARRDYQQIGNDAILMIVAAFVYFLVPTDAIPDFLTAVGLVDDLAVLGFVGKQLYDELQRFRGWEKTHPGEAGADDADAGSESMDATVIIDGSPEQLIADAGVNGAPAVIAESGANGSSAANDESEKAPLDR